MSKGKQCRGLHSLSRWSTTWKATETEELRQGRQNWCIAKTLGRGPERAAMLVAARDIPSSREDSASPAEGVSCCFIFVEGVMAGVKLEEFLVGRRGSSQHSCNGEGVCTPSEGTIVMAYSFQDLMCFSPGPWQSPGDFSK